MSAGRFCGNCSLFDRVRDNEICQGHDILGPAAAEARGSGYTIGGIDALPPRDSGARGSTDPPGEAHLAAGVGDLFEEADDPGVAGVSHHLGRQQACQMPTPEESSRLKRILMGRLL